MDFMPYHQLMWKRSNGISRNSGSHKYIGRRGKTIIMHVGYGFTEQEIAVKLEMKKSTVHTKRHVHF